MAGRRTRCQALDMNGKRCNDRYLPDAPFPDSLKVTSDLQAAIAHVFAQAKAQGKPTGILAPVNFADTVQFLGGRQDGESTYVPAGAASSDDFPTSPADDDIPF